MLDHLILKEEIHLKKTKFRNKKISLLKEKLLNWEYWPFYIVYFPIFIYWLWLSIKARSFFFFSASNPSIETGGMLGESKSKVLELIPDEYKAKTILIKKGSSFDCVLKKVKLNFNFPVIAKPDIGERGFKVEKIADKYQLLQYCRSVNGDFIIQEYVDYQIELGVFYYRFPDVDRGLISSITLKEFLTVTGDGRSTIRELIEGYPRALFQLERLEAKLGNFINYIPAKEEVYLLEPIGNHCRGTKFINANHYIDSQLTQTFDKISKSIHEFYYGRFDLRCKSIDLLKEGKEFKIVELNGAGSEPAHIYHPGTFLYDAYKVLFSHWKILYKISKLNHQKGMPYMNLKEAIIKFREMKLYKKTYISSADLK